MTAALESRMVAWTLVPMRPSHRNCVFATWKTSYSDSKWAKSMVTPLYYQVQQLVIAALLKTSTVLVAVDPEDEDVIYGWACWRGDAFHYIFVDPKFRGWGIARALLDAAGVGPKTYTHRAHNCQLLPTPPGWEYSPILLAQELRHVSTICE